MTGSEKLRDFEKWRLVAQPACIRLGYRPWDKTHPIMGKTASMTILTSYFISYQGVEGRRIVSGADIALWNCVKWEFRVRRD
jgi:hypothetical protein